MEKANRFVNKQSNAKWNNPLPAWIVGLTLLSLMLLPMLQPVLAQQTASEEAAALFQKIRSSVVLVRLQKQMSLSEGGDGLRQVLLNGALVDTRFRPNIVKVIQSNGVAYDNRGHVVSYIGYGWLALNPRDPGVRIDLVRADGLTSAGQLVGVDQRAGIMILQGSPELHLQARELSRLPGKSNLERGLPEGIQKEPYFLVDLDAGEAVRKIALRHVIRKSGLSGGTSKLLFVGEPEVFQGQLVFSRDGSLMGFVYGGEPDVDSGAPNGVVEAQRNLADVNKIIATKRDIPSGWLGLFLESQSAGPAGARILVREVVHGSPAETSGIRQGDELLRIEGQEIKGDVQDFLRVVRWAEIGSKLKLQTRRGDSVSTLPVQVVARADLPESNPSTLYLQFSPGASDSGTPQIELSEVQMAGRVSGQATGQVSAVVAPPRLGIVGDDLTPQLGNFFGVEGGRGVLIISVAPGSLAERHGMKAGDVIVALNEDPVVNQLNFLRVIERHAGDPGWSLRLMRERKPVEVKITLRPNPFKNQKTAAPPEE